MRLFYFFFRGSCFFYTGSENGVYYISYAIYMKCLVEWAPTMRKPFQHLLASCVIVIAGMTDGQLERLARDKIMICRFNIDIEHVLWLRFLFLFSSMRAYSDLSYRDSIFHYVYTKTEHISLGLRVFFYNSLKQEFSRYRRWTPAFCPTICSFINKLG